MREHLRTMLLPLAALGLLLGFNALFSPGFFELRWESGRLAGTLIDVLDRTAPIAIVAVGMTLVIATAGIDLSVGAIVAVSGSVAAAMLARTGFGAGGAVATALIACALAGAWNGALVAFVRVQPIVATLVLMVAGRGVAQLVTDGQIISVAEHGAFTWLGSGRVAGLPVSVLVAAAVIGGAGLATRRTALGLFIEAVGAGDRASTYAGVSTKSVRVLVYTVSGLCAGIAGLLYAADITAADANNAGLYLELDAILAVVIGGTALTGGRFTLAGSVIGAVILQTLTTTILLLEVGGASIPAEWNLIVKASVVLLVCLVQSAPARLGLRAPRRRNVA